MRFEHHSQRGRYELKYLIDEPCARRVRDFVRSYLRRDPYARPHMRHAYPIYSLYLDDPGLAMYRASFQGQMNRMKLRIRYYDANGAAGGAGGSGGSGGPGGPPLFCEIKRRVNDVVLKQRAVIRREALDRVLCGCHPRREDLWDGDDAASQDVLREFCNLRNAMHAEPKMIVYYEREAWVGPEDDNLRVTFDRAAGGAHYERTLAPQRYRPAQIESVILELKFDDRFPTWMRDLAQSCDLYRTKMGKYVQCVEQVPRGELREYSYARG
jgi:hypothetical protein